MRVRWVPDAYVSVKGLSEPRISGSVALTLGFPAATRFSRLGITSDVSTSQSA